MPLKHARLITSWVAISGQIHLSTDWLPGLPLERLDLLRRTLPPHGLLPRPVDLFESPIPRLWLLSDARHGARRDVVALYNWDNRETTIDHPLDWIGLDGGQRYAAFDYWANTLLPPLENRLRLIVPPRSCRIIALRPASDRPQLVSTSRHVTQGIVDVVAEQWNRPKSILSGTSKIVAGDPYELRVIRPRTPPSSWTLKSAGVNDADRAAGVRVSAVTEEDNLVRVRLDSPESREVNLSLRFLPPCSPN